MIELFIIGVMFLLAYIAFNLDDVHVALKIGFTLLIFGLLPWSFTTTANVIVMEYGNGTVATTASTSFQTVGGIFTFITWIVFGYFIIFQILAIFSWAITLIKEKGKDKDADMFDKEGGEGRLQW